MIIQIQLFWRHMLDDTDRTEGLDQPKPHKNIERYTAHIIVLWLNENKIKYTSLKNSILVYQLRPGDTHMDNDLLTGRHQGIIWTKAGILLIQTCGASFNWNLKRMFSFKKTHLKMSAILYRPKFIIYAVFCFAGHCATCRLFRNPCHRACIHYAVRRLIMKKKNENAKYKFRDLDGDDILSHTLTTERSYSNGIPTFIFNSKCPVYKTWRVLGH